MGGGGGPPGELLGVSGQGSELNHKAAAILS